MLRSQPPQPVAVSKAVKNPFLSSQSASVPSSKLAEVPSELCADNGTYEAMRGRASGVGRRVPFFLCSELGPDTQDLKRHKVQEAQQAYWQMEKVMVFMCDCAIEDWRRLSFFLEDLTSALDAGDSLL